MWARAVVQYDILSIFFSFLNLKFDNYSRLVVINKRLLWLYLYMKIYILTFKENMMY